MTTNENCNIFIDKLKMQKRLEKRTESCQSHDVISKQEDRNLHRGRSGQRGSRNHALNNACAQHLFSFKYFGCCNRKTLISSCSFHQYNFSDCHEKLICNKI